MLHKIWKYFANIFIYTYFLVAMLNIVNKYKMFRLNIILFLCEEIIIMYLLELYYIYWYCNCRFPSNLVLRDKWIKAIAIQNKQKSVQNLPKYSRICILHFASNCLESVDYSQV